MSALPRVRPRAKPLKDMTDDPYVYRLIAKALWENLAPDATLPLAPVDEADGFFHLSTRAQVLETARLYYSGIDDLRAVGFTPDALGAALRFEPSRGGDLFPHYYGAVPVRLARCLYAVTSDASGHWSMKALPFTMTGQAS